MTPFDIGTDSVFRALRDLATYEPDPQRSARLRMRAHRRLGGRSLSKRLGPLTAGAALRRILEPTFVGAVAAVYLWTMVQTALRLYGGPR